MQQPGIKPGELKSCGSYDTVNFFSHCSYEMSFQVFL